MIDEREIALAIEHPRGTELRRLGRYREALADPVAYAQLPEADRDAIVRWAEVRRRIRERAGVDRDPRNLADPLIAADRLRAHVFEGERIAAGDAERDDPGGDVVQVVRAIRARSNARG